MKIKLLILGLGLGASILAGCNDDFSSIGTSIQPGDDTIAVYMDTFQIQATTVQLDSIYARSTSAQLGELYDPLYGNLVSDYMCQFYCPSDFQFAHTPYEGKIDSVEFNIYYNGSNKNGVWVETPWRLCVRRSLKLQVHYKRIFIQILTLSNIAICKSQWVLKLIQLITQVYPTPLETLMVTALM